MPILRFPYDQEEGSQLEHIGPLIPVTVSLPGALAELRSKTEPDIPEPIRGRAILDTGAFATAIDMKVFSRLSIPAIDHLPINSVSGHLMSLIFPANISFPELGIPKLEMERVIGCELGWRGEQDDDLLMLMGRDLLKKFLVVYDGVHGELLLGH
jgi:hypothetical protein